MECPLHGKIQTRVLMDTLVALGAKDVTSTVLRGNERPCQKNWRCTKQIMTVPRADGRHQLVDDGGDATLLMHKGKELKEKYPRMMPLFQRPAPRPFCVERRDLVRIFGGAQSKS